MVKKSPNGIHGERLAEIKPFIGFSIDARKKFTPYQKRKIKRYHDALQDVLAKPGKTQIYNPRKKENREALKAAVGLPKSLSELKAIPIQASEKTDVRFTKNGPKFVTEHVGKIFYPVAAARAVKNPDAIAREVRKKFPGAKSFSLSANGYENRGTVSPALLEKAIAGETQKYQATFQEWFTGVWVYDFKNQADLSEYRQAKEKAKQAKKTDNAKKRRRARAKKKKR